MNTSSIVVFAAVSHAPQVCAQSTASSTKYRLYSLVLSETQVLSVAQEPVCFHTTVLYNQLGAFEFEGLHGLDVRELHKKATDKKKLGQGALAAQEEVEDEEQDEEEDGQSLALSGTASANKGSKSKFDPSTAANA